MKSRTLATHTKGYALFIDFEKAFDSIDHKITIEKIQKKIQEQKISKLNSKYLIRYL